MAVQDTPERGWRVWRTKVFAIIPFLVLGLGLTTGEAEEGREKGPWQGFRWVDRPTSMMSTNANQCQVQYWANHEGEMIPIDPAELIEVDESVRNRHMIHMEMRRMCAAVAPRVDLRAEIRCTASITSKQISKRNHWMCQKRRFPRKGNWRPDRG